MTPGVLSVPRPRLPPSSGAPKYASSISTICESRYEASRSASPVPALGYPGGSESVNLSEGESVPFDDPLRITSQHQSVNYTDPNFEIIGIGGKVMASGRISFKVEVTNNSIKMTGSGEGAGVNPYGGVSKTQT